MKYSLSDFRNNVYASELAIKENIDIMQEVEETKEEVGEEVKENISNIDDTKRKYTKTEELVMMRELYTEVNEQLYPFAIEVIEEYEYVGSPIYDEDGVSREVVAQMTDKVLNNAKYSIQEIEELELSESDNIMSNTWSSWLILRSATESILLNDIFNIRRAKYFDYY